MSQALGHAVSRALGQVLGIQRRMLLRGAGASLLAAPAMLARPRHAHAHPYHVSLAEAHHRPSKGRLEVALHMSPEDLDAELGRRLGRSVELGAHPFTPDSELDTELARLLRDDFRLSASDGLRYGLHLVGRDIAVDHAWIYFELAAPTTLEGLSLWVGLLFGLEARMENTVNLFTEQDMQSFLFRRGAPAAAL